MALTGLQIQKLLPKTNCKECGSNTCLAFAMKLAAKKADLSACPYASDEAKTVLGAASEPPVRGVALGEAKLGEETVLYRHDRTFVHQTALAINVNADDNEATIDAALAACRDYVLVRVGETLTLDAVAVTQRGAAADAFVALARKAREMTEKPLVLRGETDAVAAAADAVKGSASILCAPDADAARKLAAAAKDNACALAVTGDDLDELAALTAEIKDAGFNDLLLQFKTFSPAEQFQTNSIARRAALKDSFKPLGYPTLKFIDTDDLFDGTEAAVMEITKYGGVCVLPTFDAAQVASLMTLRQNIYTDPQKPIPV